MLLPAIAETVVYSRIIRAWLLVSQLATPRIPVARPHRLRFQSCSVPAGAMPLLFQRASAAVMFQVVLVLGIAYWLRPVASSLAATAFDVPVHLSGNAILDALSDAAAAAMPRAPIDVYTWPVNATDSMLEVASEPLPHTVSILEASPLSYDGTVASVEAPVARDAAPVPAASSTPSATIIMKRVSRPVPSPGLSSFDDEVRSVSTLSTPGSTFRDLPHWAKLDNIVWFTWLLSVGILTGVCVFCFDWTLYLV